MGIFTFTRMPKLMRPFGLFAFVVPFLAFDLAAQQLSPSTSGISGATAISTQVSEPPRQGDPSTKAAYRRAQRRIRPIAISIGEAIDRGLKANLGLLTSQQSSEEIRAQRLRALSGLLPKVSGQLSMTEQQLNLQALGIQYKASTQCGFSIPTIAGPYSYQAALINVNAPLFDYSAISNFRASRESQKAALLSIKNARDLVVQAVGNAYLQIIADSARITATQAEIDADNAVFTNATRRHDAGTAIGIDVSAVASGIETAAAAIGGGEESV